MKNRTHTGILAALMMACACLLGGCSAEPTAAELLKDMMTQINAQESGTITWYMGMDISENSTQNGSDAQTNSDDSSEESTPSVDEGDDSQNENEVLMWGTTQYSTPDALTDSRITLNLPGESSESESRIIYSEQDNSEVRYTWNGSQWYQTTKASRGQTITEGLLQLMQDYSDTMFVTGETSVSVTDSNGNEDSVDCIELSVPVTPEDMMLIRAAWLEQLNFPIGDPQESWNQFADSDYSSEMSGELTIYLNQDTHEIVRLQLESDPVEPVDTEESAESETEENNTAAASSDVNAAVAALDTEETWSTAYFILRADYSFTDDVRIEIPDEALQAGPIPDDVPAAEEEAADPDETAVIEEEILAQFGETEQELCSRENVAVCLTKISRTSDDKVYVGLHLVNDSDRQMEIYSVGAALNNTMFEESSIYEVVPAGGTKDTILVFSNVSLYGIDHVGSVSIQFEADDTNGFNVFDRQICTYVLDPEYQDYVIPENETASVVYEDDFIRVTALAPVQDSTTEEVPMFIENLSDSSWSLTGEQMTDPSGNMIDGTLYGDLFPHTYLYTCLNLDISTLNMSGYPIPDQVNLVITSYDPDTMKALFTTEQFTVTAFDNTDDGTEETGSVISGLLPTGTIPGQEETEAESETSQDY